ATLDPGELLHVVDVEVAHTRVADLLRFEEILESRERLFEWHVAAPVEKVEVDLLDVQTAESSIAGRRHGSARGSPSVGVLRDAPVRKVKHVLCRSTRLCVP